MSFGGGSSPDNSASDAQARIAREQWNLWRDKFAPQVDSLLSYVNDPNMVQNNVDRATTAVGDAYRASEGSTARAIERYGATVTPEEQAAMNKERALSKSLDLTQAANDTRVAADARRDAVKAGLFNIGQGVTNSAQSGWGQVAQMQSNRNAANSASAASAASSNASMAGAAASIGLMAAMMM
jgi:hypothetical protein